MNVRMWIRNWTACAACRGAAPEDLFVQGAAQHRAKLICRGCPVRAECLAEALDSRIQFGVWGGMTERDRRALLRRRPEAILLDGQAHHAAGKAPPNVVARYRQATDLLRTRVLSAADSLARSNAAVLEHTYQVRRSAAGKAELWTAVVGTALLTVLVVCGGSSPAASAG